MSLDKINRDENTWYLDDAVELIRTLNKLLYPKSWAISLGGSVLNKGFSTGDLDLVILPFYKTDFDIQEVNSFLEEQGWVLTKTAEDMINTWRSKGSKDTKYVQRWSFQGKLIDTIFPCGSTPNE